MRFKIDANLPKQLVGLLASGGHEADTVLDEGLKGEDDTRISEVCLSDERALITLDTDFADIRTYPPAEYPGLLVLRLKRQDKHHVLAVMDRILVLLTRESPRGKLWIIDEQRVRVR